MMKKLLLFIALPLFSYSQIFSENFDGVGPGISAWTLYNVDNLTPATNVSFVNNAWVSTTEEFDNRIAMSTSWYTPTGVSNDWLVTPQINLSAGTKTLFFDARSYDATFKDSYKVYISTTGNAVADFTTEIYASATTGENNNWTRRSVDLSSYTGNVYIAFRNISNDMFLLGIDNVTVVSGSTCDAPARNLTSVAVTTTSATINWSAVSGASGYDIALVAPGTLPTVQNTVATNSHTYTNLTPNTRYQFYVRNSCGSAWIGPYSIFTATTLPYSYGFETTAANGGYNTDGWSGAFTLNGTAGAAFYADGVQMVFSNSSTTAATNRWLFSRPISLSAGEEVTLKFSTRSTSTTVNNTLIARVGNAATIAGQTSILSTVTVVGSTFTETTTTYTAPTAGTYYFSFNHNNPATSVATSLVLDKIIMTSVLSNPAFNDASVSIYPNPVKDIFYIENADTMSFKNISLTDVNGRTIKNIAVNTVGNGISTADLNSGIYFLNIETTEGSAVKKIIKN